MYKVKLENGYQKIVDIGIKDAFNRKVYVKEFDGEFQGLFYVISKREQEKRRKESYAGYRYMNMKRLGECIDITEETYSKLIKKYDVPNYYITEKWNPLY